MWKTFAQFTLIIVVFTVVNGIGIKAHRSRRAAPPSGPNAISVDEHRNAIAYKAMQDDSSTNTTTAIDPSDSTTTVPSSRQIEINLQVNSCTNCGGSGCGGGTGCNNCTGGAGGGNCNKCTGGTNQKCPLSQQPCPRPANFQSNCTNRQGTGCQGRCANVPPNPPTTVYVRPLMQCFRCPCMPQRPCNLPIPYNQCPCMPNPQPQPCPVSGYPGYGSFGYGTGYVPGYGGGSIGYDGGNVPLSSNGGYAMSGNDRQCASGQCGTDGTGGISAKPWPMKVNDTETATLPSGRFFNRKARHPPAIRVAAGNRKLIGKLRQLGYVPAASLYPEAMCDRQMQLMTRQAMNNDFWMGGQQQGTFDYEQAIPDAAALNDFGISMR